MSVRWTEHGFLAECPVGGLCTQAGKSTAAAQASGMCFPALQGAEFPAKAVAVLGDDCCRPAPSLLSAGWSTAVTPTVGVPSQRVA